MSTPPAAVSLTTESWERLTEAFEQLAAEPPATWRARAAQLFADAPTLHAELLAMLGVHDAQHALAVEARVMPDVPSTDEGALAPGTVVGVWRLRERVGEGGMGEIYRAERAEGTFAQAVAIKVIRGGFVSDELRRRFDRERRILARLQHPHIVSILDGGTLPDGRPWLAMPWVDGRDIVRHATDVGLGLTERLRLFRQVCAAVAYANAQLVVHRDLKPSNILVSENGDVHLLDFGIAKLLGPDTTGGHDDESRIRLLTPEHAAPEQLRGEAVSTATDVYGLGVLLFELLTGTRPFRSGGRPMGTLEQEILTRDAPAPSEVATTPWRRQLRGDLDRIVLMALRKDPARRYTNASALGDDVARYLGQRPVHAETDRLGYRATKFVRRNPVAVTMGALLLAVLLAFTGTTWRQSQLLARERDAAQRERASAEQALALLSGFFTHANPRLTPGGDTLRVGQLLTYAVAQVDSLHTDRRLQARLLRTLGGMYMARGEAERAEELLRRAHAQLLPETRADSLDRALIYHELARAVEAYRGRAIAAPMFRQSVNALSRLLPDTARDRGIAQLDLASYTDDVVTQQALTEALASDTGLARVTVPIDRAERIHALAMQRLAAGRVREAIGLFEETLRVVDSLLPLTHPDRILVFGNVAAARRAGGDFAQALGPTRERIALLERQRPLAPLALAAAHEMEAVILAELGDFGRAERLERSALAVWRQFMAPTQPSHALTLHNLAFLAAAQGRPAAAVALMDSALAVQRLAKAPPAEVLGYEDARAELLMWAGRWTESGAALRAITTSVEATFPPNHQVRNTHTLRRAVQALHDGQPDAALALVEPVRDAMRPLVPSTYPLLQQAECVRAVALGQLGGAADARACERYRRYGVHSRALMAMAR